MQAQIAHKRGLKVAIVTVSSSAADKVIEKVADRSYIAVRFHSLGKHSCELRNLFAEIKLL